MKIEVRNLTVLRAGGIRALDGVNCVFDSASAAAFAVLGANGAGKSTLLECILGLVNAAEGEIRVDALAVEKKNFTAIRAKVGMIFQNSDDQLFSQTVREDVEFGPLNLGLPPPDATARADAALAVMRISHLADRDVIRLSGGEKRRAALAGVLAMRPDAILLDEPSSMLDPRCSRELAEHLNQLPALKVVATHDLAFARAVCRRCLVLCEGRVAAFGPVDEVLANRALLDACGLI